MACGTATPTDPGVPPRTQGTGAFEVAQVTRALAGRYRIERVVGEGGMATVYLAEDQKHKRKVAVKVMRPELAATLGADRFLREVQIAAQLNHPNILAMHDSGEADGILYYVMPYVEGETLKERLEREGALPPEEALRLARELVEALAYAHKRGNRASRHQAGQRAAERGPRARGGLRYRACRGGRERRGTDEDGPRGRHAAVHGAEQAAGERDIDGRADIYAAGAILYEMLTASRRSPGRTRARS
jgi:serine/threonine-protein kinase